MVRAPRTNEITGASINAPAVEGWVAPTTNAEVSRRFFAKHGENPETRAIDRKWRKLGSTL